MIKKFLSFIKSTEDAIKAGQKPLGQTPPSQSPGQTPPEPPIQGSADPPGSSGAGNSPGTYHDCYSHNTYPTLHVWGRDSVGNPAFAVFYSTSSKAGKALFTCCMVYRGAGGHFPAFEKMIIVNTYDYKTRVRQKKLYHPRHISRGYYAYPRYEDRGKDVKEFQELIKSFTMDITSLKTLPYEAVFDQLNLAKQPYSNFLPARNPDDVLQIPAALEPYKNTLYLLFSNTNLYTRQRLLQGLIDGNPPEALYDYLLLMGSAELISGLFLALAKSQNPVLAGKAADVDQSAAYWLKGNYLVGVRRCIHLYTDAISEGGRSKRAQDLYSNPLRPGKQGIIDFKQRLQTAEIIGLPDIIGQLACGLDTGTASFESRTRTVLYFRRYLRRVMDGYIQTNEAGFMTAMKAFLTAYAATGPIAPDETRFFLERYLLSPDKLEMWANRLDDVLELALVTRHDQIAGAFHALLTRNPAYLNNMPYEKLIDVATVPYQPTAELAVAIISQKLQHETVFEPGLIMLLARCPNPAIQSLVLAKLNSYINEDPALLAKIIQNLLAQESLPEFLLSYCEECIFALPENEMKNLLLTVDLERITHYSGGYLFKFLRCVKYHSLPKDELIIDLLENGAPATVNALVRTLDTMQEELHSRLFTVVMLLESKVYALNTLAKTIFEALGDESQTRMLSMLLDSPDESAYRYGLEQLKSLYEANNRGIPTTFVMEMLEHPSHEVRGYVSAHVNHVLESLGDGQADLFLYYAKTLLLLPNKLSAGKRRIYELLPLFVRLHENKRTEVENVLLGIGSSNVISDAENALVALARIKEDALDAS